MKVLVYGREPLKIKASSILTGYGVEVINISHAAEIPAALESCEKPHLALIDRKAKDAVSASECVQKLWGIFTVLIMGPDKEDWQGLESFMASGYVPDTFSNGELVARLLAIHRRATSISKGVIAG